MAGQRQTVNRTAETEDDQTEDLELGYHAQTTQRSRAEFMSAGVNLPTHAAATVRESPEMGMAAAAASRAMEPRFSRVNTHPAPEISQLGGVYNSTWDIVTQTFPSFSQWSTLNPWQAQSFPSRGQSAYNELHQQYQNLLREHARLQGEGEEMRVAVDQARKAARYLADEMKRGNQESHGQGRWACEDEETTSRKFSALNSRLRDWAKWYALSGPLAGENVEQLRETTGCVTSLFQPHPEPAGEGRTAPTGTKTIPADMVASLVLFSLLTRDVYLRTFANPWYFLDFAEEFDNKASQTLQTMSRGLQQMDAKQAHKWRALAFRTLFPKTPNLSGKAGGEQPATGPLALEWTHKAARAFADAFIESGAKNLMRPLDSDDRTERLNQLAGLYSRAGQMSNALQTQMTDVDVIEQKDIVGQIFTVDLGTLEAHRLHKLMHDYDTSADGRKVSLVLNPIVRASGNDDGESYGEDYRILAKACVILDPPERGDNE